MIIFPQTQCLRRVLISQTAAKTHYVSRNKDPTGIFTMLHDLCCGPNLCFFKLDDVHLSPLTQFKTRLAEGNSAECGRNGIVILKFQIFIFVSSLNVSDNVVILDEERECSLGLSLIDLHINTFAKSALNLWPDMTYKKKFTA